jgi:hypothetical protein
VLWVRDHLEVLRRRASEAFPGARLIPIGSYSRGTAIAVHSNVDALMVLPQAWATWGARRVAPQMILQRIAQDLVGERGTASVRQDGRTVVLSFTAVTHTVNLLPGFLVLRSSPYPIYRVPGRDHRWVKVRPQHHDSLFSEADVRSGGKLRALSRLIKAWGVVLAPSCGISSLYIDMMLVNTGIASGAKSYGDCLTEFFNVLVRRELRGISDPAGGSGVIVAAPLNGAHEYLCDSARAAANLARAALDAQGRGENVSARQHWKALFRRRL